MKFFNYERAWAEWSKPEFDKLGPIIHQLHNHTTREAGNIQQIGASHESHGQSSELRAMFQSAAEQNPRALAWAAEVIYYLGHHATDTRWNNRGQNWKFQHLATTALIEAGQGETLYQTTQKVARVMDQFNDHKPGTEYADDELAELLNPQHTSRFYTILRGDTVNHKPDMFCIGPKHLQDSQMYLDPHVAPCAHCGQDYKAHTSDHVLILQTFGGLPTTEQIADREALSVDLKALLTITEAAGVKLDGFAFVKGGPKA